MVKRVLMTRTQYTKKRGLGDDWINLNLKIDLPALNKS